MGKVVDKKVTLELIGLDSNSFVLMGAFKEQARRENWTREEIDLVLNECKKGDYNNLLVTLMEHCKSPDDEDLDDEDDFEFDDSDWDGVEDEDDLDDFEDSDLEDEA